MIRRTAGGGLRPKTRLRSGFAFGCLLLAVATLVSGCSDGKSESSRQKALPVLAVPVTVAAAAQKDMPVQLRAIGTVRAYSTVSVRSRVDGQLAKVSFKEGDEVKQGDLIFAIDPRPFEAALRQAEALLTRDTASLAIAEIEVRRTDDLANTKAVSANVVDENRARVATLKATTAADQAAIDSAKLQLDYCYIRAPIDGRMGVLMVNEGNVVKNNDTVLAVLNQLKPIYVDFYVPGQVLQEVREAAAKGKLPVEAVLPGRDERRARGELAVINNEVDATTGTILLRSVFANRDELLWPGQFVNGVLTLRVEKNAVVVPAEAIELSQQGRYVVVVKPDQTVEFRPVEIGDAVANEMVVKKGLQPNETVVTSGQLRLVQGAKVQIQAAQKQTGSKTAPSGASPKRPGDRDSR